MEHPVDCFLTAGSIISSLGLGTDENMTRIRAGETGIRLTDNPALFADPFMAARIDEERLRQAVSDQSLEGYTPMEQLFILSLLSTIRLSGIHPADPDCCLILSTTKGNIDLLPQRGTPSFIRPPYHLVYDGRITSHTVTVSPLIRRSYPLVYDGRISDMAMRVAGYLGCTAEPIVISNACISGVSALIVASRLIDAKQYKHVLVAGGDILSRFVVSGFQSFKSVSPKVCRPYDQARDGLSLGEACGAVLVTSDIRYVKDNRPICIKGGAITNDANHISGPSRTGDGLYYAISQAMAEARVSSDAISFVNAHGTATPYNDEMEAKALHWAGLDKVPLNSMKSYWGHTLGASGLIETIACMEELHSGEVFGTLGFENCGVPYPLNISKEHRLVPMMRNCLKTASGFGGCNAAIVLEIMDDGKDGNDIPVTTSREKKEYFQRYVEVKKGKVILDGKAVFEMDADEEFAPFIRAAYKELALDDRKFYKMDDLCKLGYIAATCLFAKNGGTTGYEPGEVGMILANASSSLDTDLKHQHIIDTLSDREASPAVFVYTLPNVVMGELCIRYKIQGENTFFISRQYPEAFIRRYAELVMKKRGLRACLTGWCELLGNDYEARFEWIEQTY